VDASVQDHKNAVQLLFIELRVGLARSAIQAALLLNGGGAIAMLLFLANLVSASGGSDRAGDLPLLKLSILSFGVGLFLAAVTFVNAYVAQGAIASGQASAFGNTLRRLGLALIVVSLLLFLLGVGLAVSAL
jgi:hypothetical protein